MPMQALFLCLYYSHFLLHDCSQLFMMGICAYFKCASAHLNTPMCYVVLCIQCFIKIAPTNDQLLETIPKFQISIPFCRLVLSFSSG